MTERLYYQDSYLRDFEARVVEIADAGCRVYLDRTAFYPTSGGQLFDLGLLSGAAVEEIADEGERVAHLLAGPLSSEFQPGSTVRGVVDWGRRFDHMQQHTGQHLLSAVLHELFGWATVSVHLGEQSSTVDVDTAQVGSGQLEQAERRCAEIVAEARPVAIGFEDASEDLGLRKASARTGTLRIISIEGIDRSACGGTHVRSTAEIGPILTGKTEKIRGATRIEFLCGERALKRARRDRDLVLALTQTFSVLPEDLPAAAVALVEKLKGLEKAQRMLAEQTALREGRELYAAAQPDGQGIRRSVCRGVIDEAVRSRAKGFVEGSRAVFLALSEDPLAVLLAASEDAGVHAGQVLKAALTAVGGRGGGNQGMAQGSVTDRAALDRLAGELVRSRS